MERGSVSEWMVGVRRGDSQAVRPLWHYYYQRLVAYARRGLRRPFSLLDEEDLAARALQKCVFRLQHGTLQNVENRRQLWSVLATTVRRLRFHGRRQDLRYVTAVKSRMQAVRIDHGVVVDHRPTPADDVVYGDQLARLAGLLDDELRAILHDRLVGYTVVEIAARLRRSVPTVERRIRLLRTLCHREGIACPFS